MAGNRFLGALGAALSRDDVGQRIGPGAISLT
jgi:hypothetical protein